MFAAYANGDRERDASRRSANDLRLYFGKVLTQAGKLEQAIEQFRAVWDDRVDDASRDRRRSTSCTGSTENYAQLLRVLERRAELENDPDARKQLAYDMAELYRERLDDPEKAIEAYRGDPARSSAKRSTRRTALSSSSTSSRSAGPTWRRRSSTASISAPRATRSWPR